jgi:ABC-type nitrate/sulfonate/bicarbonate transport system ATPase subunit
MIELKNINKQYKGTDKKAVHNLDLAIPTGSFTIFLGPSGCGKTTVLKMISGLEEQDSGQIKLDGSVSMVFQSGALLPWLSVYENVNFALLNSKLSAKEKDQKIMEALSEVGLSNFKDKLPREISGGQRQRIGIARALVSDAEILLMDEPFSALDIATIYELYKDIINIWQNQKKTIVLVSHSLEEAILLGQNIYIFNEGVIQKTFTNSATYPRSLSNKPEVELLEQVKNALLNL